MIECTTVPEEHPYGVVSLHLLDATCERLNIEKKIDTENNMLFKADTKQIKEDIKVSGAVSDFYSIKDSLMVCTLAIT